MNTDDRVAKLPRWAQQRIETLEMRLAEAEERIGAAQHGPADTDTIADISVDYPLNLPVGARVRFQVGTEWGEYITCHVIEGRRGRGRALELHGGDMLILRPQSGNVATAAIEH